MIRIETPDTRGIYFYFIVENGKTKNRIRIV